MYLSDVFSTTTFGLIIVLICSVLLLIIPAWLTQRKIRLLQLNSIAVVRLQPLWYLFIKFFAPKYQDFRPLVRMSEWNQGMDVMFSKERISSAVMANHIFIRIFKPEFLEAVMTSTTILNKPKLYDIFRPLVGDGLLTSSDEKWKTRRRMLTPAFHFKILDTFIPIFNCHSFTLIKILKSKFSDSFLDVVPFISRCTLDIIGETAMGVKIDSQENEESEYVKAIIRLEELFTERQLYPWYWIDCIYYRLPKGKECKRMLDTVHNFTKQVVSERKREMKQQLKEEKENVPLDDESVNIYMKSKHRRAFLDLMLHHHFMDGSISEEDICEEVDTFMFEGHDTTAMGVSWALYNLGLYPDIQDKAYQEILDVFGDNKNREVTIDDIRNLKYLECVIKETLRLYPPVPVIMRRNPEDITIHGKTIPANSSYNIAIMNVHHDPELYPNPQVFNPERFLPENSIDRHPFAYLPFSAGPRNCIGQKFAMMEEKIIIANVLRCFRIESLHPRDKVIACGEMVLRPVDGIAMKFVER